MKFAATLINPVALHKIAQTLRRCGSSCLVCFTPDSVRFVWYRPHEPGIRSWILVEPVSTSSSQHRTKYTIERLCFNVRQHVLFSQYRVKSQDNDEISLSIELDKLLIASTSSQTATQTKISLGQRSSAGGHRQALLIWVMQMSNGTNGAKDSRLDMSVRRCPSSHARLVWEPPALSFPEAYVIFPSLFAIKALVDRMKNLGKFVTVSATMNGQLRLSVDTESAKVESTYSHLECPRLDGHQVAEEDKDKFVSAEVLTEDLSNFLNCSYLEPQNIICAITEQTSIAFYVYFDLESHLPRTQPVLMQPSSHQTILTCHIPVYVT